MRSQSKDYVRLTKVETPPVQLKSSMKKSTRTNQLKSILKKSTQTKRESTASNDLPAKSSKRSSVTSPTSDIPSKIVRLGSLPPPPPPLPPRSTSQRSTRGKKRTGGKKRQSKETPKDDALDKTEPEPGETALESGKLKDMSVHKIPEDTGSSIVPNSPPALLCTPKDPTSSDDDTVEKAILESAKVKDKKDRKAKDNDGQNIVKQDSSSLFVPKRPSEPPVDPSGPSAEFSKSGKNIGSESIYGGLIEFENAILETGDDQVDAKKAMVQKIKSKRCVKNKQHKPALNVKILYFPKQI